VPIQMKPVRCAWCVEALGLSWANGEQWVSVYGSCVVPGPIAPDGHEHEAMPRADSLQ